jgi:NADPH-dependent 2,4-dienoyl-CoA reductase/sulfur reductase-like enzyme
VYFAAPRGGFSRLGAALRRLNDPHARHFVYFAAPRGGFSRLGAALRRLTMQLPTHAQTIIVGGGIAGCSVAYHLAKLGRTDVLLLEQGKLTSGTTWHAAGLVGQMRPNRNMTQMSKYGIELYATLETETGLATGWKQCGSVNVARTPERMQVLKKQTGDGAQFRRRVP